MICITLFWGSPALCAEFTLSVDRTIVEEGRSVELTFSYTAESPGESPDFSPITENFDVVSIYPSSQRYSINGKTSIVNQWILQAIPKSAGQVKVPAIPFKGLTTQAVTIEVKPTGSVGVSQDVFIETIVDKSSAYVNEHITLSFRLYYDVDIDNPQTDPLDINQVVIQELPTKQYRRRVDGRLYQVAEFSYILVAEKDGTIVIPQLNWRIRVNKSGGTSLFNHFGRFEVLQKRSQEKIIRIKPVPESYPSNTPWIPASSFEITQSWTQATDNMKVGVPNTRKLEIHAKGIKSSALPVLMNEYSDTELKIYAEAPELEDRFENAHMHAQSVQSAAIILNKDKGYVELPEIHVPWWNVERDALEHAVVPATKLSVGAPYISSAPPIETNTSFTQEVGDTTDSMNADKSPSIPELQDYQDTPSWLLIVLSVTNIVLLILCVWLLLLIKRKTRKEAENNPRSPDRKNLERTALIKKLGTAEREKNWNNAYALLTQLAFEHPKLKNYRDCIITAKEMKLEAFALDLENLETILYSEGDTHFVPSSPLEKSVQSFLRQLESRHQPELLPKLFEQVYSF